MEDFDGDMSWLTQTPRLENESPNFDLGMEYIEEDIVDSEMDKCLVSLEEDGGEAKSHVLYDNVVVEDISSD